MYTRFFTQRQIAAITQRVNKMRPGIDYVPSGNCLLLVNKSLKSDPQFQVTFAKNRRTRVKVTRAVFIATHQRNIKEDHLVLPECKDRCCISTEHLTETKTLLYCERNHRVIAPNIITSGSAAGNCLACRHSRGARNSANRLGKPHSREALDRIADAYYWSIMSGDIEPQGVGYQEAWESAYRPLIRRIDAATTTTGRLYRDDVFVPTGERRQQYTEYETDSGYQVFRTRPVPPPLPTPAPVSEYFLSGTADAHHAFTGEYDVEMVSELIIRPKVVAGRKS